MHDLKWSKTEKACVRHAFDQAYDREMRILRQTLQERVQTVETPEDIWALHNFLSQQRKDIDFKYDYRYSQLLFVFARLISEGMLEEEELAPDYRRRRLGLYERFLAQQGTLLKEMGEGFRAVLEEAKRGVADGLKIADVRLLWGGECDVQFGTRGIHPSEPRRGVSRQHRGEPDEPMRTCPLRALTGRSRICR